MRKYQLIENILDNKLTSDLSEKIWSYLLPKNETNIFIPTPKIQYHKFFNYITNDFENMYISYYYKNMIIHRCVHCSHIKYLNLKNKPYYKIDCNCINITKNFWD